MAKKEAHHGGAWKVAYADFVTAMMALFMVLWISSQDKKILLATSQYFKQPFNALNENPVGLMKEKQGGTVGKEKESDAATAANLAFLNQLAKELNRMLNLNDISQENPVDVEVSSDGLKVTLYDRNKQPLFLKNSSQFTEWGKFVMQNLAWLVDRNRLKVMIDGHAPAGLVMPDANYGLWELTTDRANSARRTMELYAVNPEKIQRVTGFAGTKPLPNLPPDSESNQRLTVSLSIN